MVFIRVSLDNTAVMNEKEIDFLAQQWIEILLAQVRSKSIDTTHCATYNIIGEDWIDGFSKTHFHEAKKSVLEKRAK